MIFTNCKMFESKQGVLWAKREEWRMPHLIADPRQRTYHPCTHVFGVMYNQSSFF